MNGSLSEAAKRGSHRFWVKTADQLVRAGARWDPDWRYTSGVSLLHRMLSAFPPPREDAAVFLYLVKSALEAGVNPNLLDRRGRSAIFALLEQMSRVPARQFYLTEKLLSLLLQHADKRATSSNSGSGKENTLRKGPKGLLPSNAGLNRACLWDKSGCSALDLPELVPDSCLCVARAYLEAECGAGSTGSGSHSGSGGGGAALVSVSSGKGGLYGRQYLQANPQSPLMATSGMESSTAQRAGAAIGLRARPHMSTGMEASAANSSYAMRQQRVARTRAMDL